MIDRQNKINAMRQMKSIHLLKNGSKIGNIVIYNTCAFDCVAHILATAFVLKANIRRFTENLNNDPLASLILAMVQNNQDIYFLRQRLLQLHYTQMATNNIINCECNVTFVID